MIFLFVLLFLLLCRLPVFLGGRGVEKRGEGGGERERERWGEEGGREKERKRW